MLKAKFWIQNSPAFANQKHRFSFLTFPGHYILTILIAMAVALFITPLPAANAEDVTIGWNANSEPDLEGYVVYHNVGIPGPPYDHVDNLPEDELADPLHPQTTLTGLEEGQEYYVALTAYNTEGIESNFSEDVCVEVVNGIVDLCESISESSDSSSGGGGGGSSMCFITTAGTEASMFSQRVARPVTRSQVLAMLFLLVILIVSVKLSFNKSTQTKKR